VLFGILLFDKRDSKISVNRGTGDVSSPAAAARTSQPGHPEQAPKLFAPIAQKTTGPIASEIAAWAILHRLAPAGGLTWGHDEWLADPSWQFDRRIDFVFYKGATFAPVKADVFDMRLDGALPPFWASDHAAIGAAFLLK
jgi:hypothetical protein